MSNKRILIGAVIGAHGIKGAVRVRSYADQAENLFIYAPITDETGDRVFDLHCIGVTKDSFIAEIGGVADRTAAEALRGTKLYVAREALPAPEDREYYEADLVGLEARAPSGDVMGKITALHDYGAGAFLEIKPTDTPSFMLPFKDAYVPTVDLAGGFVTALPPKGWLADEKPPKDDVP